MVSHNFLNIPLFFNIYVDVQILNIVNNVTREFSSAIMALCTHSKSTFQFMFPSHEMIAHYFMYISLSAKWDIFPKIICFILLQKNYSEILCYVVMLFLRNY